MDPKLKTMLTHLAALVCGALATYFSTGCNPSQIAKVESAADKAEVQALCAKTALEAHDSLLVHPNLESVSVGVELAKDLEACFKPAKLATDAGAP